MFLDVVKIAKYAFLSVTAYKFNWERTRAHIQVLLLVNIALHVLQHISTVKLLRIVWIAVGQFTKHLLC